MNKTTMWRWILLLGTGMAWSAQAEELALWNSMGADPLAGTYAPLTQSGNVTVSNLVASANLTRSGSPAANTFAAAGYVAADAASAKTAGLFWETSIKPNAGYALQYDSIRYRFRRSGTGPPTSQWAYSTNGTTFAWLEPSNSVTDSYVNDKDVALSGVAVLQNTTNRIWFRMYAWGTTNSGGWGVYGRTNVVIFSGTPIALAGAPTIGFNPGNNVQVHVSNTLNVAVSAQPTGSGVKQWSVDPVPAGATSFSGGAFHFTPAAPDEDGTFTLTVVATNAYGTTTGTLGIAVTDYMPPGSLEITFDNAGEVKTSYDVGSVTLSGQIWVLDQARIGDTESDVKNGLRAARMGSYYPAFMTSSNKLLSAGLGTISFLYAQYGGGGAGAELVVEVATDVAADDWLEVGRVNANGVTALTKYETVVGVQQPMYVRIRTVFAPGVGQVNLDNIVIAPYQAPVWTAYEQYLRQYNVTPGDSGTAEGEDWDGDGSTNLQEFNAVPKTNPYDVLSHP